MNQIKKIALTGGPGSGRKEITMRLAAHFEEEVIIVQDAARDAKEERDEEWQEKWEEDYELEMMRRQLEYEIAARKDAEKMSRPAIIICERGLPDLSSFSKDQGEDFYKKLGLKKEEALGLYDEVIHLESLAKDKPELYEQKRERNKSLVSREKALEIDQNFLKAWEGHKNRSIISTTDSVEEKAASAQSKVEGSLFRLYREGARELNPGRLPKQ